MFAEVIPYDKSFGMETLTYAVGASFHSCLRIWQLVKIPYGKTEILGIIAEITERAKVEIVEIREILEIIYDIPLLSEYQIDAIKKISQKYALAIHRVLGIFLPTVLLGRIEKYPNLLSWEIFSAIKKDCKNEIYFSKDEILTFEKISPFITKKTVIIVPDDIFLLQMKNDYERRNLPKKMFFLPSDATDTKKSQAWIDIFLGKYDIIVGTRRMLFYNLEYYDEIWYLEDSFSRDYFHYPIRIRYIDILAHITNSGQFSLKIFTSIPNLVTLSQFHFFTLIHF